MGDDFRVRFAPSPTGKLHIGNARTAVLNYLLARKAGGSFIMRIEDTDIERSSDESEQTILQDLKWLGLDWDEGPDIGGPYGPYRQSERGEHYRKAAESLVESGLAYYCYMTDEQMEEFRQEKLSRGESPVYRGEKSGIGGSSKANGQATIRFRVPAEGVSLWEDLVKGEVSIEHKNIGDFIVLRSDGRPTYNFAVVVDDIQMRISHVIRGDDHLSNTARQLMLYSAFSARIPGFAHIPMILGPDGQRLSKRHGATSVSEFRTQGYLPEALVNYLSLLSWSSESGDEFLTTERLRQEISIGRLGSSAAVFDNQKLLWLNGKHIRNLDDQKLIKLLREFAGESAKGFTQEQFSLIVDACREKLQLLTDIVPLIDNFSGRIPSIENQEDREMLCSEDARKVLAEIAGRLKEQSGGNTERMRELLSLAGSAVSVKGKMLYMPVRLALTGSRHGPDLPVIMAVLGNSRCAELIEKALASC